METLASMSGVGVRFRLPRRSRMGVTPRLITNRRSSFWGIRDVTLTVESGAVIGLIGPNGAGKTTLLRTLGGIYRPTEGAVTVSGRVGPLLAPSAGLVPSLSGWENIALSAVLLGRTRREASSIAPRVAEFAGLGDFLDSPVRTYSSGMKARLGFSVALFAKPTLLLLDEVLAVGDQEFREKSSEAISEVARGGGGVVAASHDVERLAMSCAHLVRLEGGRVVEAGDTERVAESYLSDHRSSH
jgi:ABC-type polysaccharide/polyol phosphate transport system ATPase subunit